MTGEYVEATKDEDETLVETEEKQRVFRVNDRYFYHGWRGLHGILY